MAVALPRAPAGRAVPAHRAAGRPDRRVDAGGAVRAAFARRAVVSRRALRVRARGRHPGRPRDPARDADPEAQRGRRATRPEDARLAGPHVRLPRRARRRDRVPARARPAARPDPHRRAVRADERRRRALGALAVPRRAARGGRACDRGAAHDCRAGRDVRRRRPRHDLGRGPLLRRPGAAQRDERLPARRRHRAAAPASASSSTATCSSIRATSTATTRRSSIRRWPRTARRGACWCSAAATAWPCARC